MISKNPSNGGGSAGTSMPRGDRRRSSPTPACAWLLAVLAVGLLATSCREESAAPGADSVATQGPFQNDADAIAAALAAFSRTHQAEIRVSLKSLDGPRYSYRNAFLRIGIWLVYPIKPDGCKAVCPIGRRPSRHRLP